MSKRMLLCISLAFLLFGCAAAKQAKQDYVTGKVENTPLAVNEKAPEAQAQEIVTVAQSLPIVGPYAGYLLPVLVGFLTWKRGKRIRENNGVVPVAGTFGTKVGIGSFNLENLIQGFSNIVSGAYEVGPDGSAVKRTWKVWLSIALAIFSGALFIPSVRTFFTTNASAITIVSILAGLFGGIEKKITSLEQPTTTNLPK